MIQRAMILLISQGSWVRRFQKINHPLSSLTIFNIARSFQFISITIFCISQDCGKFRLIALYCTVLSHQLSIPFNSFKWNVTLNHRRTSETAIRKEYLYAAHLGTSVMLILAFVKPILLILTYFY
jgi:hypothetical protein